MMSAALFAALMLVAFAPVGSFYAPVAVYGHVGQLLRPAWRHASYYRTPASAGWVCQAEPSDNEIRAGQMELRVGKKPSGWDMKWKRQIMIAAASTASLAMPMAAVAAGADAQDSLVQGMVAGAVAGAAVDLVLYPIDTIKTRLQTDTMTELNIEALPALYSGLIGSLAGHVPSSALFFAIYQTSKVYWLEPSFGQGAVAAQLLASALGNLGASTIRVPTEVVKTRLQVACRCPHTASGM